ncbi:c-type cytochrome [Deinococcus maricopensis]|uniref:Cytochrome c class I n=1 Tax=Deinococcus maricopensis (strain DSM 21211 / LMG 22137 / NRRL B-23946 / LB-34) TaxID=709986 RepID=E8U9X0_DEIML|nr:cytochrome c [Deinococcus maricopensis]ADV67859.1 cytochrome c class I [Deinococcus maricopensis DSM 21211]
MVRVPLAVQLSSCVGGLIGVLTLTAAVATPQAPAAAPTFTAAQVTAGQQVYAQSCQGCHGANLQGSRAPGLVGTAFLTRWADGRRPAADLHGYIAQKMPRNKPGSLTPAQALNVTAYVLAQNGYAAGPRALNAAALKAPLAAPPTPK